MNRLRLADVETTEQAKPDSGGKWCAALSLGGFDREMKMKNRINFKSLAGRGESAVVMNPGRKSEFRRLKAGERVWIGDYVRSPSGGYEPWEGPGGFSADSFACPVYRLRRGALPRPVGRRSRTKSRTA
jgi:hypothetical protein